MNKDLLNILSNSNKDIDNQLLMDYLSGRLPDDQKNEVERWMADNDFSMEAMEGLTQFAPDKNLQDYVDDLNGRLNKYIQQKKDRREKRKIKENPWTYLALLLILVLCILAYVIIKKVNG